MNKKEKEYKRYIKEHKENVYTAWLELSKWIDFFSSYDFNEVKSLIKNHDKSKFSKEEFNGYRQYFFPYTPQEKSKKLFKEAWNHHQKTNPHHWQYWLMYDNGETTALEMPFKYIIEMFCDWIAMSIKFNNKPSEWYKSNKHKILLGELTQEIVDAYIPILDNVYANIKKTSVD